MKCAESTVRRLAGLLMVSLAAGAAGAQISRTDPAADEMQQMERLRSQVQTSQQQQQQRPLALESTIDPAGYFVGPSDIFSVNVWVTPPVGYTVPVTPEGTLIIPTVGEVRVADMTLKAAKDTLHQAIRRKYRVGEITVTLVSPRPVVVTVTGNVLNPGTYTLASYYRTDKAVESANQVQRYQSPEDLRAVRETMSMRNVVVRHKDGTTSRADFTKFLGTKDDRWNPYLREGDLVIVPRVEYNRTAIGVYGAVNVQGRFEFVEGDGVRDALLLAQGFVPGAIADSIELTRLSNNGEVMTAMVLPGGAILAGTAPDVPLQAGDRLVVRASPDERGDYRVAVEGEVLYPGLYPIAKTGTRLSSVVARAGGFTRQASRRNAVLIRRSVEQRDLELERLESARGGVTADDSLYYYLETSLRLQKEIVNIDFERLFGQNDTSQDAVLRSGDVISVPEIKNTIYVYGQVVSPGHVPFSAGKGADFYVAAAGGLTERSRPDDIKIVKAKTRQWLSPEETQIEEGDYVWVPKDLERGFMYYLSAIGQAAAIIGVGISVVLLALQVGN